MYLFSSRVCRKDPGRSLQKYPCHENTDKHNYTAPGNMCETAPPVIPGFRRGCYELCYFRASKDLGSYNLIIQSFGILEEWKNGMLEYWNIE
jgi:hypothetical protein